MVEVGVHLFNDFVLLFQKEKKKKLKLVLHCNAAAAEDTLVVSLQFLTYYFIDNEEKLFIFICNSQA